MNNSSNQILMLVILMLVALLYSDKLNCILNDSPVKNSGNVVEENEVPASKENVNKPDDNIFEDLVPFDGNDYNNFNLEKDKLAKYAAIQQKQDKLNSNDYLPDSSKLTEKEKKHADHPYELNLTYRNHLNPISQSNKNPSLDIRNEPPNPKNLVSPWLMSTIESDNFKKSLDC